MELYDLYIRSCLEQLKQTSYNNNDHPKEGENNLLQVISSMRKIVNHPYLFFNFHYNKLSNKKGRFSAECIKRMHVDTLPQYRHFVKKKEASVL